MAPPISDDERDRIIGLLHDGRSARDIAAETGRSIDSISRIARSIGHRFGRTNLARATEARSAFSAERRALAAARAQERLEEILELMGQSQEQVVRFEDGTGVVARKANARDWRDWAQAVNVLQRTVLDVDRHDNRNDEGLAAVDAWLRDVVGSG